MRSCRQNALFGFIERIRSFIVFADRALYAARNTYRHYVGGNGLRNDAASAYNGVVAYGHAREHYASRAYPHVISDGDGFGYFDAFFTHLGIDRVLCRGKCAIRRDKYVVSESDR